MNHLYKRIFLCSFFFYIGSTGITRYDEFRSYDELTRIFHSLPMDDFPLKYLDGTTMIETQIGVLSTSEVIQLLETNTTIFPHMQDGLTLQHIDIPSSERDYIVIRFQNQSETSYFDIKYYLPQFPYSINFNTKLESTQENYYNIIIPYPKFLIKNNKNSDKIFMRWKLMYP